MCSKFIYRYIARFSPADMSKSRALCEESTKIGTVIVRDEVKQTRYGANYKNLNYSCLGPIFHENEAENRT